MKFWHQKGPSYHAVKEGEEEPDSSQRRPKVLDRTLIVILFVLFQLCALCSTVIAGYAYGKAQHGSDGHEHMPYRKAHTIPTATIRSQTLAFTYNQTFAQRPSPETDAAWESIFPPHGGFFHDETMAPTGASLAVYHQLHCLDGIRHAYYTLFDAVMNGKNVTFSELDDYSTDWHTRHCLDFLRQMLMCNADLTIEEVDPKLGGIRGFGTGRQHECVVWDDVRNWSIAHQSTKDAGGSGHDG